YPLRGLSSVATSSNSGYPARPHAGRLNPNSPVELRSTQSNRPKSQPPHLVYGYIYCHYQNLSSDHLLSGVVREYYTDQLTIKRAVTFSFPPRTLLLKLELHLHSRHRVVLRRD